MRALVFSGCAALAAAAVSVHGQTTVPAETEVVRIDAVVTDPEGKHVALRVSGDYVDLPPVGAQGVVHGRLDVGFILE